MGVDGDGGAQPSLSGLARGNVGVGSDSNNLVADQRVVGDGGGMISTDARATDVDGDLQLYDESCDSWCTI
eukprot:3176431-Rhodomonas_salina.1